MSQDWHMTNSGSVSKHEDAAQSKSSESVKGTGLHIQQLGEQCLLSCATV